MSEKSSETTMYFDLLDVCREPGCPICRLGQDAAESYIDVVLYELVDDARVQAQLQTTHGYCNRHAWLMPEGSGRSLNIAILQRVVLDGVLKTLGADPLSAIGQSAHNDLSQPDRSKSSMSLALEPQAECPACQEQTAIERNALAELTEHLADRAMTEAFQDSDGLCLPHFRQALSQVHGDNARAGLIELQRAHFERVRDELAEFIHKNGDGQFEINHELEGDSWLRAIELISGQKGTR